jgi:hypothetical protein
MLIALIIHFQPASRVVKNLTITLYKRYIVNDYISIGKFPVFYANYLVEIREKAFP